jgi:hypothetical protein
MICGSMRPVGVLTRKQVCGVAGRDRKRSCHLNSLGV